MKQTHGYHLQTAGTAAFIYFNGSGKGFQLFSYSDRLSRIRNQHPGMEKTIVLLATMASKKKLRIILADDDEDDRELFAEAIADNTQVHLETAKDGIELMKMLKSQETNPDIIFLDLNMPGKSGKKCLEEIRKNKEWSHIPIVIYSTSASVKDVDDTFLMGANLYIRKPNSFQELAKVIKKVFSLDWNEYRPKAEKKNFVFNIKSN